MSDYDAKKDKLGKLIEACPYPKYKNQLKFVQDFFFSEGKKEWLNSLMPDLKTTPVVVCHNDVSLDNVLLFSGNYESMMLIDFDRSDWNFEGQDLADYVLDCCKNKDEFSLDN